VWLHYSDLDTGDLNYTRVRTGFTSDDSGLRCFFLFTLGAHRDSLSLFLTHTLVFSTRFSLRSLSDYRSGIIHKAHSRLRIGTTNQISFVYSCRVRVFICGRGCACMLTVISHDTGNNVNIRIK